MIDPPEADLKYSIFNRQSSIFTRSLLTKFSKDLILPAQNVVSYQLFDSFSISFTHKVQHPDMVFIADISQFVILKNHLSESENLISECIDHMN